VRRAAGMRWAPSLGPCRVRCAFFPFIFTLLFTSHGFPAHSYVLMRMGLAPSDKPQSLPMPPRLSPHARSRISASSATALTLVLRQNVQFTWLRTARCSLVRVSPSDTIL
jgi:hypothetical protein